MILTLNPNHSIQNADTGEELLYFLLYRTRRGEIFGTKQIRWHVPSQSKQCNKELVSPGAWDLGVVLWWGFTERVH